MPEIQPFRGVLYNTERVKPADVLTQPYDKITVEMRERYLKLSPYNLVQIEFGKEQASDTETNNKYTRARDLYRAWLRDRVLRRPALPALYYLEQTFTSPIGMAGTLTRKALIARVRLHRWDEGCILPHEHTLSKPKADRLALLRACGSQQGQIFMLYPKPERPVSEILGRKLGQPTMELLDDYQVTNKLWEITDPAVITATQETLRERKFYIADGHHRYETALAFRDECREAAAKRDVNAPHEFVMATLVDTSDPGLVILPTHRTVGNLHAFDRKTFWKSLAKQFAIQTQPSLEKLLRAMKGGPHLIGMRDAEEFALLRPKNLELLRPMFADKPALWDRLDVAILHVTVLEALLGINEVRLREESNVTYWREPEKALEPVQSGAAQLAFFLNPTRVNEVQAIADARSRMPQKSTDFYPKLLSGLVIHEVCPDHVGVR
jgi:uncharacterized protein (DUF1015 family)